MVSTSQNLGHFPAAELSRAGVLGLFEESRFPKTLSDGRFRITHHPRNQAGHSLDHQASGHFPARQYDVTHRDLVVYEVLAHALIDTFIATA
jgi:hypothetical protein